MNIFSVLDDSDNEEQQTKVVPKAKDTAKPAAAAKKDTAAKPVKAVESKGKETAPKTKTAPVGAEKPKGPVVESAATDATKDDNRGGRPRGKEYRERGGRGGRGGEPTEGERRPKRDFDRRSSTGRGRGEASKGGRGSFGSGNPAQDAQDAEKDPNSAEAVVDTTEGAEDVEPEVVAEPEPTTFTLDQFMEKRNEARRALLATETKVRSVDQSALAGLSRKEDLGETTYMPVKASKADASRKDQRSTGKTQWMMTAAAEVAVAAEVMEDVVVVTAVAEVVLAVAMLVVETSHQVPDLRPRFPTLTFRPCKLPIQAAVIDVQ
eukprot:gene23706-29952_t